MGKILEHKRILFICPDHYDFPKLIATRLEDFGAVVDIFTDIDGQFYFRLAKILGFQTHILRAARKNLLQQCERNSYDYFFVIKGNVLDADSIRKVKEFNPGIKTIMYQWDSLKNYNYSDLVALFDKAFSFDYSDTEDIKGLSFLSLFYIDNGQNPDIPKSKRDIDILAYGVYYPERYRIVRVIQSFANKFRLKVHLKLYIPVFDFARMILKERKLHFKNLSIIPAGRKEISSMLARSQCVIDVHHHRQTGLTSRTIEALGAQCKLLTTNKNIVKESFYNENVIRIIDDDDFSKHLDFIRAEYTPIPFESYSLTSFLMKLFC